MGSDTPANKRQTQNLASRTHLPTLLAALGLVVIVGTLAPPFSLGGVSAMAAVVTSVGDSLTPVIGEGVESLSGSHQPAPAAQVSEASSWHAHLSNEQVSGRDAVVVLGGGLQADGTPPAWQKARCAAAAALYNDAQTSPAVITLSGGKLSWHLACLLWSRGAGHLPATNYNRNSVEASAQEPSGLSSH